MAAIASARLYRLQHVAPAGTTLAVVAPEWGANVIGFSFHPVELRWPVPFLEPADIASIAAKPTSYGIPILAPTPGRVGRERGGVFRYEGTEYRLAHEQHGFARHLPWSVVEHTPSAITCALAVHPKDALGSFPFEFDVEHRIVLGDSTARRVARVPKHEPPRTADQRRLAPLPASAAHLPRAHPGVPALAARRSREADPHWRPRSRWRDRATSGTAGSSARTTHGTTPSPIWRVEDGVSRCWVEDEPVLVGSG